MSVSRCALLRWQFDFTWSLFEYHLDRVEPEDFLWEPGKLCWTVHRGEDGVWRPDWDETELDPIPVPTVAWITWHIGWWWSTAIDHMRGRTPRERVEITWPGDGASAVAWLRELRAEWATVLDGLSEADLDAEARYPWPPGSEHQVSHMIAWLNAELMKNVAEIGELCLLRRAS